jgi:hypothetical protein
VGAVYSRPGAGADTGFQIGPLTGFRLDLPQQLATAPNGSYPEAYLSDTLAKVAEGHRISRIDELMPWNWLCQKTSAQAA